MKKIFSGIIAMILLISVLCTGAMSESADITGDWYADFYGMTMTMTLNEDGSYIMLMDIDDEDSSEGTWEFDGNNLIMDKGSETEIILSYDPEAASLYVEQDGMEFLFTRDVPVVFEAAPARTDATIEEFAGAWTCTLIDAMGLQAPPELMEINMSARIEGSSVTLVMPEMLDEDVTLDGIFADGTLTVTVPAESEYSEDMVFTIQLLEDGTMSIATSFVDELMVFYMIPEEIQE